MMDPELVTRKLTLILQDLPALTDLARKSRAEYLGDPIYQVLAERYVERTIGRMIDVNYHVITESGHAPPKDYHESFVSLGPLKILPTEFAHSLAAAAGLRNRIVHEYDEIDAAKLHEALQIAVKQIPVYVDAIRRVLPSEP
ncbi:MAG TPA: DUF86 domain-containing protein [Nitrospiraceae bacterium]|nr:DUF86 domain-containing protein [Nitrospiraceae bacterium]